MDHLAQSAEMVRRAEIRLLVGKPTGGAFDDLREIEFCLSGSCGCLAHILSAPSRRPRRSRSSLVLLPWYALAPSSRRAYCRAAPRIGDISWTSSFATSSSARARKHQHLAKVLVLDPSWRCLADVWSNEACYGPAKSVLDPSVRLVPEGGHEGLSVVTSRVALEVAGRPQPVSRLL